MVDGGPGKLWPLLFMDLPIIISYPIKKLRFSGDHTADTPFIVRTFRKLSNNLFLECFKRAKIYANYKIYANNNTTVVLVSDVLYLGCNLEITDSEMS